MPITLHSPPKKNTKPPQLNSYGGFVILLIVERYCFYQELIRFGDDLLSHVLRRSTIGATALNGWVRDGTRCFARAMITKPNKVLKRSAQQSDGGRQGIRRMPVPAPSPLERRACSKSCTTDCMCMLLIDVFEVLLLLDQIKPIEQLVPVN